MSDYATKNIELYALDEEIARLKAQHEAMLVQHAREQSVALELLLEGLAEIGRLKGLLGHAADKIERVTWSLDFVDKSIWEAYGVPDLVAQLRKEAGE